MTDLNHAVTVVADADHTGSSGYIDAWVGWWVIFPLVMMIFMLLMMSRMFFSRRTGSEHTRSESGSQMGPMCMGPMGAMSGHGDDHQPANDGALGVLRRRYASGKLTDDQFDSMLDKLEEP